MSYEIRYDTIVCPKPGKPFPLRQTAAAVLVCILIAGAVAVKSIELSWVKQVLLPGDPEVTAGALEHMVDDLRGGDNLLNAVTAFCREIIENA